jgi:hypothetical protein
VSFISIVYIRAREKRFYFSALTSVGWGTKSVRDDWIGKGTFAFRREQKSFEINNSDPGFVYSKCLDWKDYRVTFDFRIGNRCVGVIVRAINLSNYAMLQITPEGINPHIRVNGGWAKIWRVPGQPKDGCDGESNLVISPVLAVGKEYNCELTCRDSTISIRVTNGSQVIIDGTWEIPNEPHPINLEFGTAGFRNCTDEK